MKKLNLMLPILFYFLFNELLFHITVFKNWNTDILYIIAFSLLMSFFIYFVSKLFNKTVNTIIYFSILTIYSIMFCAQFIYYQFYQSLITVYSLTHGGQVFEFWQTIGEIMLKNWWVLLLMFIPLIISIVLAKFKLLDFEKISWKEKLLNAGIYVVFHFLLVLILVSINPNQLYSNKNLYFTPNSLVMTANKFGLSATMRLDLQRFVLNVKEQEIIEEVIEKPEVIDINTIPNRLEIDFDTLTTNETDAKINQIHNYFKNKNATYKNDYTGMFKGKNLIVFVAEAFSDMAVREDVTPNLYKLYKEGFQFTNFYNPVFPVSTADGEYITDTSLIPKEGVWSLSKINGNYMPYSYPNVFENLGYSSNAYHNHTYTYYKRNLFLTTMGYNSYLGCGNGLEKKMSCKRWPNSDYEMIDVTTADYLNNEHFLAYYMTVSGHLGYTTMGNNMASRNWDTVKSLPYSHKANAYLSTQVELDKAIGLLLQRLEEANLLEDTVILLSADHYPYGLTLDEINEISAYQKDDNFDKHKSALLLWSGSMKKPIVIDKYASSLDIVPTILNLFGIDYDSRLLMGTDILSNSEPLVIFSNRSFITDKGKYSSITGKFTPFEGISVDEEYVNNIKADIKNKYLISKLILENNYYNYISNDLKVGVENEESTN